MCSRNLEISGFDTMIGQIADKEAFLESVQEDFHEVEDPRSGDNQIYPFVHFLIIILRAILAGANTILDIYDYAHFRRYSKSKNLPATIEPGKNAPYHLLTIEHVHPSIHILLNFFLPGNK